MWTEPIYDRVSADITTPTSKGFFNIVDWIRIYGNSQIVNALVNVLRNLNIPFSSLTTPTITSIPTVDEINSFVSNIERVRVASNLPIVTGIIELKDDYFSRTNAPSPDYEDVNDWERDLELLKEFTISLSVYMVFCGVATTGQIRFWQNQYRNLFVLPDSNPVRRVRCGISVTGAGLNRQNGYRRYSV